MLAKAISDWFQVTNCVLYGGYEEIDKRFGAVRVRTVFEPETSVRHVWTLIAWAIALGHTQFQNVYKILQTKSESTQVCRVESVIHHKDSDTQFAQSWLVVCTRSCLECLTRQHNEQPSGRAGRRLWTRHRSASTPTRSYELKPEMINITAQSASRNVEIRTCIKMSLSLSPRCVAVICISKLFYR